MARPTQGSFRKFEYLSGYFLPFKSSGCNLISVLQPAVDKLASYTEKDSLGLGELLLNKPLTSGYMCSFDVKSLFTVTFVM